MYFAQEFTLPNSFDINQLTVLLLMCRQKKVNAEKEKQRRKEEKQKLKADRRKEREEKRRLKRIEKKQKEEEERMQLKIALEERRLLIAQRKLESLRLLSELFERVKVSFHL